MGSKRFYEHAQSLLGGVKGSGHYLNLGRSWDYLLGVVGIVGIDMPNTYTCLFKLRPCVLSNTLSHMWGKLNLPMFLFSMGLLTLIKIDSLVFLAKLCPSLPIIWKLLWLVGWPVWLLCWWIGEGSFRCSLYLCPKVLEVFLYIHHHRRGHHIGTNIWPHLCWP